ncbi:MAG: DUF3788 domain-containing protein [Rhodothermaceae bacterium]
MRILFCDKSEKPTDEMIQAVLGRSYKRWEEIQNILNDRFGIVTPEWKYYGKKSGWSLKMLLKKRNLFFFGPCDKYFRIGFIFGDRAVKAIEESDIPEDLIEKVKNARRYAEGRGLQIEVRTKKQIDAIIKLVEIKINN